MTTLREHHIAVVTDNADPEQRGRVKVECGTLLAAGVELPDWVEPSFPYLASIDNNTTCAGWLFTPDVGVVVEIELITSHSGDQVPGMILSDSSSIRWRACLLTPGKDVLHDDFKVNYPNRRGIITSRGHGILFDDTDGSPLLRLYQAGDTTAQDHWVILDKDGITMDADDVVVRTTGMKVKNTSPTQYPVVYEGGAGSLAFTTLLKNALTEISAGLAGFGMPVLQTGVAISSLAAGTHTSGLLKVN